MVIVVAVSVFWQSVGLRLTAIQYRIAPFIRAAVKIKKIRDGCVTCFISKSLQYFQKERKFDIPEIFRKLSGNPQIITSIVDIGKILSDDVLRQIPKLEEVFDT